MLYTVTWSLVARNQLIDLWANATDRTVVALASHEIDRTLRDDPHTKGWPFAGDRLLNVPPLRARVRVDHGDMLAEVCDVWEPGVSTSGRPRGHPVVRRSRRPSRLVPAGGAA